MAVFLTIISGVAVFVLGQIALKLFVDPWQRQRECVAHIAYILLYYANVYSNPGVVTKEKNDEASVETRRAASELVASSYRIPCYSFVSKSQMFPTLETINEVRKQLIGLSNSTHDGDPLTNGARVDKIRTLLRIPDDE